MKNKSLLRYFAISALAFTLVLQSCKKDDDQQQPALKQYSNGVFITNEGAFTGGTGSVSFWSRNDSVRDNDIYNTANGVPLGNVVQSMALHFNKAYIVVNNSNKIEVTDPKTLANKGTINNLQQPRYFVGLNESKGYVTEWVNANGTTQGRVSVINLATNQITKSITVGIYPEKIALAGNKLFVVNSGDSTVSVINTTTDVLENTFTVGSAPNSVLADKNGNLWVLCGGNPWISTPVSPSLVKFNPNSPTAQTKFDFASPGSSAMRMIINSNRDKLYYIFNNGVYEFDIAATSASTTPIIPHNFYSIGIDPQTGEIYASNVISYSQPAHVVKYNTSFTATDSMLTDIIPSDFYFVN